MQLLSKCILLATLGIILAGCVGNHILSNDAVQVSHTAAEIADFDLPAGYGADFSATVMGYTMAAYRHEDGRSHLYLIQSHDATKGETLDARLDELSAGRRDEYARMTTIETRPTRVRGQEATLVISEGSNSEDMAYRQATAAFQGKNGPALLVLSEPLSRWDEERVNEFVASLR